MPRLIEWKKASAVFLLCAATAIASSAQTFKTLVAFDVTNGEYPHLAALVQGTDGNFYGTTFYGGANSVYGTVFKITTGGALTSLYSFCAQVNCPDGANPQAGLVQAINGSFYGTTIGGGANGDGTVFKITSGGTLTTLHSFDGTDGYGPNAGLVQATDGNFYGTTTGGGANGDGTVFKITSGGTLTTLHSFEGTDGSGPFSGLVQAINGSFYGTTIVGGANNSGTVFEITSSGTLTTLYSFCAEANCTDGASPQAGLVQGTDANFYGTTAYGGFASNGTVFKITSGGTLTTLHTFCLQNFCPDGTTPLAGLVQGTDGDFYGTISFGGANNSGTVFKITSGGTLTTLHSFCAKDCRGGAVPWAGVVQATDGNFYGTTVAGGDLGPCRNGCGTVYSLGVGLGPFVETRPTSGKVGAAVIILGTNLKGATSVSFNGTAARFTVVSSSEIKTTVPAGATTGAVTVVTPSGPLASNVVFRVTPFVQGNSGPSTIQPSNSSVAVSYLNRQTAGNLNVVAVGWGDNTSSISLVTDSDGNTYTQAVGPTSNTKLQHSIYYAKNIAGGSGNTVTVKFNQAAAYPDVRIVEYSGLDPTNPLDVTAAAAGNGTSASSGSATTTSANELIFGAGDSEHHYTAAGSGFTSRLINIYGSIAEDEVVSSSGNYNATATNSAGFWVMQMATFKAKPLTSQWDTVLGHPLVPCGDL